MLICTKNQLHPSFLSWDIAKILQILYLDIIVPKTILPACRKLWCLLHAKNHIYPPPLFWNITKILQTCYIGYFGHDWPCQPKAIALACTKLWCLSVNKRSTWSLSFLQILHFKNPAIWLAKSILGNNSRARILPDMEFVMESQESKEISFCIVFRKNKRQNFFKKIHNTLFLGLFCPNLGKNWAPSFFRNYSPLISCEQTT